MAKIVQDVTPKNNCELVTCPKCRGCGNVPFPGIIEGVPRTMDEICDLCAGKGEVPEGVEFLYVANRSNLRVIRNLKQKIRDFYRKRESR